MATRHVRSSRQVAVAFAVVAIVSSALLGALAWQLVQQDRQLDEPRRRGLAEEAADTASANLAMALREFDAPLRDASPSDSSSLPDGVSLVSIGPTGTTMRPAGSLAFVPTRPPSREATEAAFAAVTALEYGDPPDLPGAIAAYRSLATSGPPEQRATALARLAPLLARSGDISGALAAREELDDFDDVSVGGLPAGLVSAVGAASDLAKSNHTAALRRKAVFSRFVRGAESRTRRIRGTGIGLAFVRQIVEAHGGRVTLTSAPGRGSRFELVFHAAPSCRLESTQPGPPSMMRYGSFMLRRRSRGLPVLGLTALTTPAVPSRIVRSSDVIAGLRPASSAGRVWIPRRLPRP